ncbi:MCM2/3/5 family-domain-containing protein [Gilbertella persicaria]|uniref:DNA replication licensing factor MCM5 n=1 Tax=Rhizopus stolonifer TaxID=4846 RepID=A0A367KVG7_RHIST|nr:MCM2/3/5 family-domain-containing protein [Gilbertella persicaria]KAI8054949.1 MCM2/3/5 family-domain-containing protein [Gilbertella persicaria]RCI06154.1 minichromosome maintenance protein 5 [Rhizopus stolonifer]
MASFGWDQGQIYSTSVLPGEEQVNSHSEITGLFYEFIQNFRLNNNYIYRDQLSQNLLTKQYFVEVDINHLINYNADLANKLTNTPADYLPLFENAVKESAKRILFANPNTVSNMDVPDCQVTLQSDANVIQIRDLNSDYIGKLVRIPGIVIGASTLSSRATQVTAVCRNCRHIKVIPVTGGFSSIVLPRKCDYQSPTGDRNDCPMDPFVINHDKCKFVDSQVIKLQEAPDMVPVGDLPRHTILNADRWLTNRVVPGMRTVIMGIYSIFQNKAVKSSGAAAVRTPYIRIVGLQIDQHNNGRGKPHFTDAEEEEFIRMSRQPDLYETFSRSLAPSIFGNMDIKKAITCLLFGGSKKVLPDGMRLRGDISVLLLGDPGTAKSQLLKFTEKVAPIAVYTSGKGSSAAGLTASVIRDPSTRDFYLEGGAMVLADGGVVCIDEFDKMRDEDRVAIHEAMEQQTISIAKAGITTILNSRTSVLAAANPVFGRYDDMKSAGENIDFQTTILSRFDMIFIVKDDHNENRDMSIARHVLNVHMNRQTQDAVMGEIDLDKMKAYINYCKAKCAPRLTPAAAEKLSAHFVAIRKEVKDNERDNEIRSTIPITIRQLEAIIRISESLAKMTLSPYATEHHVEEALRLFKFSTMDAVKSGGADGMTRTEIMSEVQLIEKELQKRIPIGSQVPVARIKADLARNGYSEAAINRALTILNRRDVLLFRAQGKMAVRQSI